MSLGGVGATDRLALEARDADRDHRGLAQIFECVERRLDLPQFDPVATVLDRRVNPS